MDQKKYIVIKQYLGSELLKYSLNYNVLLRFIDIADEPAAAIHTQHGKGAVILTGIYPEFIPEKGASSDELIQQLSLHYLHNQELLAKMLNLLGVPLKLYLLPKVTLTKQRKTLKLAASPRYYTLNEGENLQKKILLDLFFLAILY